MMPTVLLPAYAAPLSWAALVALETSEGATSRRCNDDPYGATNDHCTDSSRLECATKKNVGSKHDEYGNCRRSDGHRQLRCPTLPQEQPDTSCNVGKASNKVKPKNEGNNVASGSSFFCPAKQSLSAHNDGDDAEYGRDQSKDYYPARTWPLALALDLSSHWLTFATRL